MKRAATYLLLALAAAPMVIPFVWMIVTAFNDQAHALATPPVWLPWPAHPENFSEVADRLHFGMFAWNSVKISVLSTIGQVFSCSLAAYAFARFQFKGKNILFAILLATMIVPFQVTMVPVFSVIKWLGWVDSHAALVVPSFFGGTFGGAAFGTFLLRQFFETIPQEYVDAAVIDGASRWRVYWNVMLPLARPALATLALFVFMGTWNDLLQPAIYLSSTEKMTLTVGLASLQSVQQSLQFNLLMAGAVLCVAPIVIVFLFTQKYFVKGMLMTGVKG